MRYINFNDIPLSFSTSRKVTQRIQRAQFGDGYTQVLTDGLNTDSETWSCETVVMPLEEIYSIESYLLSLKGQTITWTPPNNQKDFARPIASGELHLGYTNISTITVTGYTRPTDYTINLATGLLTSVTIPDGTVVEISITLDPKTYLLGDGWQIKPAFSGHASMSFELVQVYV